MPFLSEQMGEPEKQEPVTHEEALLRAYRLCDQQHRDNILQFVIASSRRSIVASSGNVVRIDQFLQRP